MDVDEVGREVRIRLEIERQVRDQLSATQRADPAPPSSWVETKLGLLLIGALVSGVLVPTFQWTQDYFEWRRENRHDALTRQIAGIHDSLKQFIAVQAASARFYDLGLAILEPTPHSDKMLASWSSEFRELQTERLKQNASFAATIFYLPDGARDRVRESWNALLEPSQRLQTLVGRLVLSRSDATLASTPAGEPERLDLELDRCIASVNDAYERVLSELRGQLAEVEHASAELE